MKTCPKCKIEKDISEFYFTKSRPSSASTCKECFNKYCIQRWIDRKIKAIEYKGNKCVDCNLHIDKTHYSVFEFHHLNPSEKNFNWTQLRLRSDKSIKKELDRCVLLCANCHRIRHALFN